MFETSRLSHAFLGSLFVLCVAGSCVRGQADSRHLVSPELLRQVGLEIVWDNELPIRKAEKLKKLQIVGKRVYALSSRNYLMSLDRKTGKNVFSKYAAPVGQPVAEPVLYEDELISVLGNRLVEMSERTGEKLRVVQLEYGITCPPARNKQFLYLSGVDRRLHVLKESNRVQVFEVAADNNSMINSIIAADDFVVFGTDAGNVIRMQPDKPVRLWQFDAAGGIAGRLVLDGASLFFASRDTNVYRVGLENGKLAWKYQVAGIPKKAPRVTKAVVYQYIRKKGVTAIDKRRGVLLWTVPDGLELLAEAKGKAYVMTENKTLVVMDNATAKRQYSIPFEQVSRYACNTVDSKIYVGDDRGRIACIQAIERK
ncbi:MAG: PQQ-binding-like beta-propeller repeat protein [Phycisphaerae bacterium]|nr:PQQ-binding-like beta-propeller repeat protein [Phycisphaerae bacterium]